jgi:excisionase family DNA binding protein
MSCQSTTNTVGPLCSSDLVEALEAWVMEATPAECAAAIGELERIKIVALSRMLKVGASSDGEHKADTLLTMQQVAERLNLPKSCVYELARRGKLPSVRIGKYVRVRADQLADFKAKLLNGY